MKSAAHATAIVLVVAALFLQQVVGGLYEGLQRQLPDAFPILSSVLLPLSLVAWFSLYSRERGVPWVMDMGWFLIVAWIVVIPYYILKREGRAGLGRVGLFCLTWFAAWATGRAVSIWMQVIARD
jgi:hypothetical protein